MSRTPVIGFEVHAQLRTRTKIFCACGNSVGGEPNTRVCPVCLGLPGALPVLNERVVELGAVAALALGADVADRSSFARKSYFYPDLPKGYQITQDEFPLATGGGLDVERPDGNVRVRLRQIHVEEDAGKTTHRPGRSSLVDMNRCGVPLLEIVTMPDLTSVEDAVAFAEEIRRVLVYCGVTSGLMHEGSLRFDTNASVMGEDGVPGTPCEIKNLNSFRSIRHALEREIARQNALLDAGARVVHETLLWDERGGVAVPMRSKEEASDYRYFREPDLPDVTLSEERIAGLRALVPELPSAARSRLRDDYGLAREAAAIIADDAATVSYYEEVVAGLGASGRDAATTAANWLVGPVRAMLHERGDRPEDLLPAERLARIITLRLSGELSEPGARTLLEHAVGTSDPLDELVERLGLARVGDRSELAAVVRAVLDEHTEELARLRNGERKLVRFLMGKVMARTRGSADPEVVRELIEAAAEGDDAR